MDKQAAKLRRQAQLRLDNISKARAELAEIEVEYEELTNQLLLKPGGRELAEYREPTED